jgi:hypothetical protein
LPIAPPAPQGDHPEVGVPVGINSKLGDIDGLLSKHALDGDADLPLVEYEGLRIENTPARQYMRIDPDGRRLPAGIEACLPYSLADHEQELLTCDDAICDMPGFARRFRFP